jgi:hypothetical protein
MPNIIDKMNPIATAVAGAMRGSFLSLSYTVAGPAAGGTREVGLNDTELSA